MNKKKLVTIAIVVVMIATLSFSTLAYFTAQDKVTNNFTVSSSMTDFDIDVWEEVPGPDNTPIEVGKGNTGTNGTTYTNVLPGVEYLKTVHVTNTSGNELAGQYIKVEVTFTGYKALKSMGEGTSNYDCTGMLKGANFSSDKAVNSVGWWYDSSATKYSTDGNEATYTFYLKSVLENEDDVILFEKVALPENMDINDAELLVDGGGFKIDVVAYAIQSANITDPNAGATATALDHAIYAFGQPWTESQTPTTPPENT